MSSPGRLSGAPIVIAPVAGSNETFMKVLNDVPMRPGSTPYGDRALTRFSKQLGW